MRAVQLFERATLRPLDARLAAQKLPALEKQTKAPEVYNPDGP